MSKVTALVCACAKESLSPISKLTLQATLIDRPVYMWAVRACLTAGADNMLLMDEAWINSGFDIARDLTQTITDAAKTSEIILVIDAIYPLISADFIRALIEAAKTYGAARTKGCSGTCIAYRSDSLSKTRMYSLEPKDPWELTPANSAADLANISKIAQSVINSRLLASGVFMRDPSLVWAGPDVTVAPATELLPMTMLFGKTTITGPSIIGPNTRLTDCTVAKDCVIDETVGISAVIESGVTTGPRAYLRPGTHLLSGAHVGTHVEIKNSTVGKGSKVPHLSYIGDTTMGSGVNIGAGSITCNYDGEKKHPTTIGDGAFIGSDTMMVAPVNIGEGAVTGASSCITKDVPKDALALERSKQLHIKNYHNKKTPS